MGKQTKTNTEFSNAGFLAKQRRIIMNTMKMFVLTLAIAITLSGSARADEEYTVGNYNIAQMTEEGITKKPPMFIDDVKQLRGELRLYLLESKTDLKEVNNLISSGALEAQMSYNESGKTVQAALSLYKTVTCKKSGTYQLKYAETSPNGCTVEKTQYYLRVPITLGKDRDLSIGIEPDYIWLIEEK